MKEKCKRCGKRELRPIYGKRGIKGRCCTRCRQPDDVDLNKKRCVVCASLNKEGPRPVFGLPGGKTQRCKAHRIAQDVDLCSKKCISCVGHRKRALFASATDGVVKYCFTCKPDDYLFPSTESCTKCRQHKATFGSPRDRIALRCKECSIDGDEDVVNLRCICGSGVRPVFGIVGDAIASFCFDCKDNSLHVDVHNPMCIDCGIRHALYGSKSDKVVRMYCRDCTINHSGDFVCVLKTCMSCSKCAAKEGFCITCHPDYLPTAVGCSKQACSFFDALEKEIGVVIQHTHLDRTTGFWNRNEYNSKKVKGNSPVDGFIKESNMIIEFEGDVFHGHPSLWQDDPQAKSHYGHLFSALYEKTERKLQLHVAAGYKVAYLWSSDLSGKKTFNTFQSLMRTFDGKLQPRPLKKRKQIAQEEESRAKKQSKINVFRC